MKTLHLGGILAFILGILAGCTQSVQWSVVDRMIDQEYPEVEHISVDSLQVLMQSSRFVLLDTRSAEEFAVSRLQGAIHFEPGSGSRALPHALDEDMLIVTYCSVGYRSAAVADALQSEGRRAVNLRGSIFEWANRGYPVYRNGVPVRQVHPYDRIWGRLLEKELHAYEPS